MSEPFGTSSHPSETRSELFEPATLPSESSTMSAFFPVLLLGLVLLGWFGFQAVQLRAERDAINDLMAKQEQQLNEAKKLRDSFYAIAHGAELLADSGNGNARLVVDGLKKRGVTITPNPQPTGANPPASPAK